MGSIISGIFGGGSTPAQAGQQAALKASRDDIHNYRPEAMQARLNLLRMATAPYQGMNNALETLWGDPNAQPQRPVRMMGHDLPDPNRPDPNRPQMPGPQQPVNPQRPPHPQSVVGKFVDPLGIFGGGGIF